MFWMHFFTGDHVAKTLDPPSSLRADNLPDVYLRGSSIQVGMISSKPACPKSIECQAGEILKSPQKTTTNHSQKRNILSFRKYKLKKQNIFVFSVIFCISIKQHSIISPSFAEVISNFKYLEKCLVHLFFKFKDSELFFSAMHIHLSVFSGVARSPCQTESRCLMMIHKGYLKSSRNSCREV